jgi:hypothetical protein
MRISSRANTAAARRLCAILIGGVLCVLLGGASAASAAEAPAVVPYSGLRVTSVDGDLVLGGRITVRVRGLRGFLTPGDRDVREFVLYLDDRRIDGLTPMMIPGQDALSFDIRRTDASLGAWNELLGRPTSLVRPVSVSVGYGKDEPLGTDRRDYPLRVIRWRFWPVVILVGFGLLAWFVALAERTSVIRDPSPLPEAERPYSLARSQMALWFFVVLASFFGIWAITGATPPLSDSALALTGISVATALGAKLIDKRNDDALKKARPQIKKHRDELWVQIETTGVTKEDVRKRAKEAGYHPSKTFWRDVLSDADGHSIHRFQMAVWTIMLAVIFLWNVYLTLSMPDFPGTLLALMGISGGTYVGFKGQERVV